METYKDIELISEIVTLWHEQRNWAEQLLKHKLGLSELKDIFSNTYRGKHLISGTQWLYRTHGLGIDIYKPQNKGGIDFDIDNPHPTPWQLREFFIKQYNDGKLTKKFYRLLMQDEQRWDNAVLIVLGKQT